MQIKHVTLSCLRGLVWGLVCGLYPLFLFLFLFWASILICRPYCAFSVLFFTLFFLFVTSSLHAKTLETKTFKATPLNDQAWSFSEPLNIDPFNISGIVVTAQFMALVTDEGAQLEIFTKKGGTWHPSKRITLTQSLDEIDIEAIAWQTPYLYALGSHSAKRKKIKDALSQKDNLKRLQQTSPEVARQQVFRVQLNAGFEPIDIQILSLQTVLEKDTILKAFIGLPSKENGIDMEGLAIDPKGRLLVGLRGPVLRSNISLALRIELKDNLFEIKKTKLLFVNAGGRGIRGLSAMDNGFLVLTGAVGDQTMSYRLYAWDGKNALAEKKPEHFVYLCDLPHTKGKPEGVQFLKQTQQTVHFVIVEDGLINGQPKAYTCPANPF